MIVFETLASRWFAFAFIAAFFWAAAAERGWRRALRFWGIASVVALLFEYTSTHSPFPYGRYDYTGATRGDELYVSNVPLFVPLSHAVLMWAGRAIALSGFRARSRAMIPWLGALGVVVVDLVVDPVALRGHRWFLGDLFAYRSGGDYFGVPLSNFAGWILTALIVLWLDEALDVGRPRSFDPLRGTTLALGVMGFNVLVALVVREWGIALAGLAITATTAWLCLPALRTAARGATGNP